MESYFFKWYYKNKRVWMGYFVIKECIVNKIKMYGKYGK